MATRSIAGLAVLVAFCGSGTVEAALFLVDISPNGGARSLTNYAADRDHVVGLGGPNETAQPATPATGDEIGSGIIYDDVANELTFNFGYGSGAGFVDLTGNFSAAHFHGPGSSNFPAVNTSAGIVFNLGPFHTPIGTRSGTFSGIWTLTAAQETNLFDNQVYINIHSSTFGTGEIRGQLVLIPEPNSLALCVTALVGVAAASRRRWRPRGTKDRPV